MPGLWSQSGVPHKGWTCIGVEDLGSPDEHCEMCGTQEIRYVHHMAHEEYHRDISAGCVCAENMEDDYIGPKKRENQLRNVAARRRRWLSRIWKISSKGIHYLKTDGMHIVIYSISGGRWKARITDIALEASKESRRNYPDRNLAKLAAFDAMIFLKNNRGWGV